MKIRLLLDNTFSLLSTNNKEYPWLGLPVAAPGKQSKQGSWARLRKHASQPALSSILLANFQSKDNKLDGLRTRMTFQCDTRNYNIMVFTETWLKVLDSTIVPVGFSIYQQDRTVQSGEKQGRRSFMVNNSGAQMWR